MQSIGHVLVAHHSMNRTIPNILAAYPSYVYSGSLGPDWFYNLYGGLGGYERIADTMHAYGSRSIYLAMLDTARLIGNDTQLGADSYRCFEAARAFAHGFITHVAADCIFHPYVNRRANNPWTGDKHGASAHAGVETVIDNMLWPAYGSFSVDVNCAQNGNPLLPDYPVRQLFKAGVLGAYSDQSWLLELLEIPRDVDVESHPVNKAFRAVLEWTMFSKILQVADGYNVNDVIQHLKSLSLADVDVNTAINPECNNWCDISGHEILHYSAEQLFEMAIWAAADAITVGEKYVNGEISSFDCCGIPFLEKDYNLDTGLPSDQNNTMQSMDGKDRFTVGTQLLAENYSKFGG